MDNNKCKLIKRANKMIIEEEEVYCPTCGSTMTYGDSGAELTILFCDKCDNEIETEKDCD